MNYDKERARAERYAERVRARQELREIRHRNDRKKMSTSKLLVVYLFGVLNVILVFAMVAMWRFADLSALPVLITDIAAQVLTLGIYMAKSVRENTAGGVVFEKAMREFEETDAEDPVDSNDAAL